MGSCATYSRYCLILLNTLVLGGSVAVLVYGIRTLFIKENFQELIGEDNNLHSASVLLIAAGATGTLSFLGCFGAWKRKKSMLLAYLVIVVVILTLTGAVLLFTVIMKNTLTQQITQVFKKSIGEYVPNKNSSLERAWDSTQQGLKCCGYDGPSDWSSLNDHFKNNTSVPESCCNTDNITTEGTSVTGISTEGIPATGNSTTQAKSTTKPTNQANSMTIISEKIYQLDACPANDIYRKGCKSAAKEFIQMISNTLSIAAGVYFGTMLLLVMCTLVVVRVDEYERY